MSWEEGEEERSREVEKKISQEAHRSISREDIPSESKDHDADVVLGAVVDSVVHQGTGHILRGNARLAQLDRLLVLTDVPQAVAGDHHIHHSFVNLDFLVIRNIADPLHISHILHTA